MAAWRALVAIDRPVGSAPNSRGSTTAGTSRGRRVVFGGIGQQEEHRKPVDPDDHAGGIAQLEDQNAPLDANRRDVPARKDGVLRDRALDLDLESDRTPHREPRVAHAGVNLDEDGFAQHPDAVAGAPARARRRGVRLDHRPDCALR
jgi:hypothetical protein